ncbi:FeoB-associated Cys-rich membrane protein [Lentilactobacillus raoultii]|uniref:FeoB-associated Cys-rich membrane protein n=1 Tax=Lentilactobacillus raoultii TaxID=1987503 RepID=A0ABW3PKG6_9LACO
MGTIFVGLLFFGLVGIALYNRFFKAGAKKACHECSEIGCLLVTRTQAASKTAQFKTSTHQSTKTQRRASHVH